MYDHIISEPITYYKSVIPDKLIDVMVAEYHEKLPDNMLDHGQIGQTYDGQVELKTRNSMVAWLPEDHWVCSIIEYYIRIANKSNWEYDLKRVESIQVTVYDEGCHYSWHSDYGTSTNSRFTRKLSASLLISDPNDYEGGDLEFINYHGETVVAPKEKGTIIVFDSRIPHRVTPVKKGRRVSLVTWMYGPKLK